MQDINIGRASIASYGFTRDVGGSPAYFVGPNPRRIRLIVWTQSANDVYVIPDNGSGQLSEGFKLFNEIIPYVIDIETWGTLVEKGWLFTSDSNLGGISWEEITLVKDFK